VNFLQFLDASHISTLNYDEMAGDTPRQPAHEIFSIKRNFSSPSSDLLNSRKSAQAGVKDSFPLKSGYFTAIGLCSVKTVVDRYRHAAYQNKHW